MAKILAILSIVILLSGCAMLREATTRLTDEHIANMENAQVIAERLCTVSNFQSGFLREAMGDNITQLPAEAVAILDEIDILTKDCDCSKLTSRQKGEFLGLWSRFFTLNVMEIIEEFAPQVIQAIGITL